MRGLCLFLLATAMAAQNDAVIEGTVVDKVTGARVQDAVVFAYQRATRGTLQGMTDANGDFKLAGLGAGSYAIEVRHAQYPSESRPLRQITLAAGERKTSIDLSLTPPGAVSGRVVDTEGDASRTPGDAALGGSWLGRVARRQALRSRRRDLTR